MPSSYPSQIPLIIDILIRLDPSSILDIGTGFGKYGFLAREYLEVWGENNDYGKFNRRIDGVEPFQKYITPCHRYIYNRIFTKSALEFAKEQSFSYDLVLLIDVIEHLDKDEGMQLLKLLVKNNKNLLITTPKKFYPQGAVYKNPYEIHRSFWSKKALLQFGKGIDIPCSVSYIVLLGEDYAKLKRYRLKRKILNILPGFFQGRI